MNTPLPAAVPAPGQPRTSMDELMLAMDIVDTLRHEQSLVERELASTQRDEDFVARVKQIYASQGIEVSDALIRQGVEALKQDRFAYVPPRRTLAVRLAEAWVDRGRRAKRAMIAGFVGVFGYAIVAVPNAWMAGREYGDYAESVQSLQQRGERLRVLSDSLSVFPRGWSVDPPEPVVEHLRGLGRELELGEAATAPALSAAADLSPLAQDRFASGPEAAYAQLAPVRERLDGAERQLTALEDRLKSGERLLSAARRFDAANARLATMNLDAQVASTLGDARARAESALAAADADAAAASVAQLEQAAATLDLGYTLRIVNRDGVQSGVWRYHEDAPGGKNYYLVVEAIDANGRALALPIANEETQRTETVSLFAIRVPPSEYERVKADKLDNGLIDDAVVGEKRRGELEVDYRVAVSGGAITAW